MKYSVLMSLYEKEKPEFLKLSIESMLSQTVPPDEIVLVKDGPLGEELNLVLETFVNDNPDTFKIVVNKTNKGLGVSLNRGLVVCRNELVARMDTDDISKPNRCEKQLDMFRKFPELSIVGAYVDEFSISTEIIESTRVVPCNHDEIYEFAKRRSAFNHPVVMYKKSKVLENGGYADLRRNQDVDLFGRMLFNGCKAGNIDESLLFFRSGDALAKRRKSWENSKSYILTIKNFWKMGYSGFSDYIFVTVAQIGMFVLPVKIQHWIYRKFLRK